MIKWELNLEQIHRSAALIYKESKIETKSSSSARRWLRRQRGEVKSSSMEDATMELKGSELDWAAVELNQQIQSNLS